MNSVSISRLKRLQKSSSIEVAIEEGRKYKNKVWSRKDMLSLSEVALLLEVTEKTVRTWRRRRKVIGLKKDDDRDIRFPSWQFDPRILRQCRDVIAALPEYDSWGLYLFFTQKDPLLGAKTPLSVLKRGNAGEVLRVAKILSENRG